MHLKDTLEESYYFTLKKLNLRGNNREGIGYLSKIATSIVPFYNQRKNRLHQSDCYPRKEEAIRLKRLTFSLLQ